MGLHNYPGFPGQFYTTPNPTTSKVLTGDIKDPFLVDYTYNNPQYGLNHARQSMLRSGTSNISQRIEHGTYVANNTHRDIIRHHHEDPRGLATNQVGSLQCHAPHINMQHHWGSIIYPDPNSGNKNTPYYAGFDRGTPIDNTTQHEHGGSNLPSAVSTASTRPIAGLNSGDFQRLNEGIYQDFEDFRVDLTRNAGQYDEEAGPLQRQVVHSQGATPLEEDEFGADMNQAENYDELVSWLDNSNNKLEDSPAPDEGQPENHGSSGQKETGYKPRILSEEEYRAKEAAKFKSSANSDFPYHNQAAQLEIIRNLFEAIRNTDGIIDKPQVGQSFKDGSIPDEVIEMKCWELMLAARSSQVHPLITRHQSGSYAKCTSFSERIELTINVCKKAKSICKMLLAPNFVHRVTDNPLHELKRKESNMRLNEKKTGQNKAGQKAIKENYARENGEWVKDKEVGELEEQTEDEERPHKRIRRNLRS